MAGRATLASSMKDFFVSYNRADRAWAEWIAHELQAAGFSVVSQFADFGAGSNFVLEMDRATKECERMIAVLSPSYLAASFTPPEWAAYFAQDPMGLQRKLVPVRVRECEVKGLLGQVVYADLVDLDQTSARSALLAGVGRPASAGTGGRPPAFPGAPARARFPGVLPRIWNVPALSLRSRAPLRRNQCQQHRSDPPGAGRSLRCARVHPARSSHR